MWGEKILSKSCCSIFTLFLWFSFLFYCHVVHKQHEKKHHKRLFKSAYHARILLKNVHPWLFLLLFNWHFSFVPLVYRKQLSKALRVCVCVSCCQLQSPFSGQSDRRMDILSLRGGKTCQQNDDSHDVFPSICRAFGVGTCTLSIELAVCQRLCCWINAWWQHFIHTLLSAECHSEMPREDKKRICGGHHPLVCLNAFFFLSLLDSAHSSGYWGCFYCNWNIDTFSVSGSISTLGAHVFVFRMVGWGERRHKKKKRK